MESNNSVNIPEEVVKGTLGNFNKLLESNAPEDRKTLLQLIISKITVKDKKDIGSIELHFDEKVQKYFIDNNEGESPDDEGSPSLFCLRLLYSQLLISIINLCYNIY